MNKISPGSTNSSPGTTAITSKDLKYQEEVMQKARRQSKSSQSSPNTDIMSSPPAAYENDKIKGLAAVKNEQFSEANDSQRSSPDFSMEVNCLFVFSESLIRLV